jgi:hypothetical protein
MANISWGSRTIAGQEWRGAAAHGGDDRRQAVGRQAHQRRPRGGLDAFELAIKGRERDADGDGLLLVSRVDGGPDPTDDEAHETDDRGEEELARILALRGLLEELIDEAGAEGVLHGGLGHDGDIVALSEAVEDLGGDHDADLPGSR